MSALPKEEQACPVRPSLTPVFICSLVLWLSCALSYSRGAQCTTDEATISVVVEGVSFLSFMVVACFKKKRALGLICAVFSLGLALGSAQAIQVQVSSRQFQEYSGKAEITLLEDSSNNGYGESALVLIRVDQGGEARVTARFFDSQPLLVGEKLICTGSFTPVDFAQNPIAWSKGSSGTFKVYSQETKGIQGIMGFLLGVRKQAIEAIGSDDDGHKLLQALVCGYRREIRDTELYARFQTCGLAHIVAVSGAHLMLVTGLFASILKCLRTPRKLTVCLLVFVMVAYFVLAGMPVSALRASIMTALGLFSFFGKRRSSSLNAVGIGIFAIIAIDPSSCLSASFSLSCLSTAGIVLYSSLFRTWLARTPIAGVTLATEALSLTFSAGLLSQLYACSLFSVLPLISPLANIVLAPLFPIVCGAGFLSATCALVFPASTSILDALLALPAFALLSSVEALSAIPFASIPVSIDSTTAFVITFFAAAVLWALWPCNVQKVFPIMGVSLLALLVIALTSFDVSDRIVMLDVGQGDSILIASRGETLLIDTGNQDTKLLEQLGRNRIAHIDSLLISHADDDHCGSLDSLRKAVSVDRIILASDMLTCEGEAAQSLVCEAAQTASNVVGVNIGDAFSVGAFTACVVWPETFSEEGGNADSLCVKLEYDGDSDGTVDFTAFMTGDAEKEEVASIIESGMVAHVDLLKVSHHGSANGATEKELQLLSPTIALISCGANNRYGHPAQETLDMLESVGTSVFRTDIDGLVRCVFTPERIEVSCSP